MSVWRVPRCSARAAHQPDGDAVPQQAGRHLVGAARPRRLHRLPLQGGPADGARGGRRGRGGRRAQRDRGRRRQLDARAARPVARRHLPAARRHAAARQGERRLRLLQLHHQ